MSALTQWGWGTASRAAAHLKIQMSPLNPINQSQIQLAILKKKSKSKSQYLEGYAGKVMVGSRHQPICIPAGSCKFLVGTAKGVPHKGNFMMEGTQDGNLPSGVAVNNTYVQPTKSG